MVLLSLIALAILVVLVYLAGLFLAMQQRQDQQLRARQNIDSLHDQTVRSLVEAARESGAFRSRE